MLPGKSSPVQRKADAAPAIPTGPWPSAGREPDVAPRPTIFELFGAGVQRKATSAEHDTEQIHASAQRGVATPAEPLPHAEQIQRRFGRHDISGIKAHTGADAATSARGMGAKAYATGDHVVFGPGADLHTAAHEAAHVLQQRVGVQLAGGIGEAGDDHERHADAVADAVVAGRSAEALLDQHAGRQSAPASAVQRVITKNGSSRVRVMGDC